MHGPVHYSKHKLPVGTDLRQQQVAYNNVAADLHGTVKSSVVRPTVVCVLHAVHTNPSFYIRA